MKKVGMISLGCAKNRVDSETVLGMLRERGFEIVGDPAEADLLFVNTCGFIESAKEESIDAILELAQYRKNGARLFVTGCLAQRYPEALLSEIPEIDGLLGVAEYARLFDMIEAAERRERPCYTANGARFLHAPRVLTTPGYSAYVKISDGCDNRCTYCAIPLIRGGYSSRPFDDIVDECRALAEGGVTEYPVGDAESAYREYMRLREAGKGEEKQPAAPTVSRQKELFEANRRAASEARSQAKRKERAQQRIPEIESELSALETELYTTAAQDYVRAGEIEQRKAELEEELLALYELTM